MRVLVIEDDEGIAHGLGLALRQDGWAADTVPSVAAAWAALTAEPFDMVLLDLATAPRCCAGCAPHRPAACPTRPRPRSS